VRQLFSWHLGLVEVGPFVVGGLLLAVATRVVIPRLVAQGWDPLMAWFASASGLVFAPLMVMGLGLLLSEAAPVTRERLWLRRPTRGDWKLVAQGVATVLVLDGLLAAALRHVGVELAPSFLRVDATADPAWVLAAWLPFFVLNVGAEELVWRGVLLPRQERAWGSRAWLYQAMLWGGFHASMGAAVVLLTAPALMVVPFVVQRSRTLWTGVAIHAICNGPPFVLVALGIV
jgi:membrane protease YdiL (CAAX protease family)